jgi:hypothetical protein
MAEAQTPAHVPLPRWVTAILALTAAGLVPWTLYLSFNLPSRHLTELYDVAWVGFDCILFCSFAVTAWCAIRGLQWLEPAAAITATMLVCDAWFDVVTSIGSSDWIEAVLEALFAELPLAAVCAFIVYDSEQFRQAMIGRYSRRFARTR